MLGGCTLLILGDLEQTLTVLSKDSRIQIVNACLTRSRIREYFEKFTLIQNMRVLSMTSVQDRDDLLNFCDYLIKMSTLCDILSMWIPF